MRGRFAIHQGLWALALLTLGAMTGCSSQGVPKILDGLGPGTYAWFDTNQGQFVARLLTDKAPRTTANFIGLAEGTKQFLDPVSKKWVKRPFYNGLLFHRVIDDFMIQGGCPLGTGTGDPGYKFADEFSPDLHHDREGLLSMANSGPDKNGCQFFITLSPQPSLDGEHTIFGEIVRGMDAVHAIGKAPTHMANRPIRNQVMEHVRIYQIEADGKVVLSPKEAPPQSDVTASKKEK